MSTVTAIEVDLLSDGCPFYQEFANDLTLCSVLPWDYDLLEAPCNTPQCPLVQGPVVVERKIAK